MTAASDLVTQDRRAERRRRVLKGAILSFNKGYGALECAVRNLSPKGALLVFGDAAAVPAVFDLRVSGHEVVHKARVRWRNLTSVGVEFG